MANTAVLLSHEQEVAIRFHLGYPNRMSDDSTIAPYYRFFDLEVLDFRLTHLAAEENARATSQLTIVETAYTNWQTAQANLSFSSAAILTNNANEMYQREQFYTKMCRLLAKMIGVSYRGDGGNATNMMV